MQTDNHQPLLKPIRLGMLELNARFAADAPLADIDWPNVYGATATGYVDYPAFQPVPA
ncbi:hypothetical protein [Burkholderia sp. Bp9140]|uniref:hypothetical protein n=1 Tax=Burkholderia sp. Bp9140 TaxID=2184572 RepID=UPI001623D15A|nr:hypothetical protein [Burkholderia sp. Bp9140]